MLAISEGRGQQLLLKMLPVACIWYENIRDGGIRYSKISSGRKLLELPQTRTQALSTAQGQELVDKVKSCQVSQLYLISLLR